jgi:hypothetical protein
MQTSIQTNITLQNFTENYLYKELIEQAGVAVVLQPCILEVLGSNVGRDTDYPDIFILQFIQANSSTSQLDHDRFLPNSFKFIINLLSYNPTLCSLIQTESLNNPRINLYRL